MRRLTIPAITVSTLLVLAACGGSPTAGTDTGGGNQASPDNTASPNKPGSTTSGSSTAEADDTEDDSGKDASGNEASRLTLTVNGEKTALEPTDVYCSGNPGNIHHIIGKTNNGLPLIEADGEHFAMVKTGHRRPYKAESPSGVDYGKDRVTFSGTSLGQATLDGTMVCTEWED